MRAFLKANLCLCVLVLVSSTILFVGMPNLENSFPDIYDIHLIVSLSVFFLEFVVGLNCVAISVMRHETTSTWLAVSLLVVALLGFPFMYGLLTIPVGSP